MVATRSPGCDAERRQQAADPRGALDEPRVRGVAVLAAIATSSANRSARSTRSELTIQSPV